MGVKGAQRNDENRIGSTSHIQRSSTGNNEEIGARKFSMVTEADSRSTSPPEPVPNARGPAQPTQPAKQKMHPPRPAVESEIVHSMRVLEQEHRMRRRNTEEHSVDNEPDSKRSSDEFFTPKETSPTATPGASSSYAPAPASEASNMPTPSEEYIQSPPMTEMYLDNTANQYYKDSKVDETVRQSVATSITENISRAGTAGRGGGRQDARGVAPPLFSQDSNSSFDFRDVSYMLSPSASDAPSPSNQWQIAQQRHAGHDILSPLQMFSPPPMPPRLSRTATATQMTPPGPPPFQPGHPSHGHTAADEHAAAQSSASKKRNSRRDSYQQDVEKPQMQPGRGSRVSFAPTITSPGGHARPLGEPLRNSDSQRDSSMSDASTTLGFSLPPSAATDTSPSHDDFENVDEELEGSSHYTVTQMAEQMDVTDDHDDDMSDDDDHEGMVHANDRMLSEEADYHRVEEYHVHGAHEGESFDVPEDEGQDLPGEQEEDEEEFDDNFDDDDEEYEERDADKDFGVDEEEFSRPTSSEFEGKEGYEDNCTENLSSQGRGEDEDVDDEDVRVVTDPATLSFSSITEGRANTAYMNHASAFITPPPHVRQPQRMVGSRLKDVPATPPSPPDINSLMESISASKLHAAEEEDNFDEPVSTMEPSAGLFQKLIQVWQSAEDDSGEPPMPPSFCQKPAPTAQTQDFVPEVAASSSTHESTLPSGDTEVEAEKLLGGVATDAVKNPRPRAMRLPPSAAVGRDAARVEKKDDMEEGTSMASFSDAFSSDDKDRQWPENGRITSEVADWEEAMKGDDQAGIPASPNENTFGGNSRKESTRIPDVRSTRPIEDASDNVAAPNTARGGSTRRFKSHSFALGTSNGVMTDGHHVRVDRRRLDWLTRELLAARDAISRKELQMTFAETQRLEQEEILLLERQDAESIVDAMKKILADRENELHEARARLSVAIQNSGPLPGDSGGPERVSVESRSSNVGAGGNLERLIAEGHARLQKRLDQCNEKHVALAEASGKETRALWNEVQKAMFEKMMEMTEKRDGELETLRRELTNRERLIHELKQSSSDLVDQNRAIQAEASELRLQKEKTAHRYELEMAHVTAQVELVNEFSKKLHDNFRETENLRQQVLQYQDKLSHITSTSGVSQRQIKELREAVTRANDECARLRREADIAKKKGMEAERRAEELEELRYKDAAMSAGRFPDRQDSGSFQSHEPVRPAGHNRPGGSGTNTRYHGTRTRALPPGPTPAQKTWLVIKEKISGFVTGKEPGSSKRRVHHHHGTRDGAGPSRSGAGGSQTSRSASRSHGSRDDDAVSRSRSAASRSSNGSGSVASSGRSGGGRSNRSGGSRPASGGGGSAAGGAGGGGPSGYGQGGGAHSKNEVGRTRATEF